MKKLILMLAFAGFLSNSYAQNLMVNEVPVTVTKSFNKNHSKIDTVAWSQAGDNFEAAYELKKKTMVLTYSASGKLLKTEKQITLSELPTSVLAYINENYQGGPIKKSFLVTNPAGKKTYSVKVKDIDLAFDSRGKFVQ